ncbi:DUF2892 domain-containing protein [Aliikangiella marina]|uniref:DUF2892 domain-containing protein n=1 Tax=Aliikangiella marina TaxID=1712262 RepID=A0A545TJA8_9GAMM|nr:DUF2892 domain-containing protein [Aliikangiella marina]TQV77293.1 DUF2892 domain-containing protein [Aliikangiella marina]
MALENAVMAFAGFMVLVSVALTLWVNPLFYWFTVFIGANLLQSAFTGFCPAAIIFKKVFKLQSLKDLRA